MHDIFHTARATCTFSIVVVGAGGRWLYPGLAVEGVIVAVLPSVVIRCSHSLGAKVLLLVPRWAFEHLCFKGAAGCSGVLSSHRPAVWICVVVFLCATLK